MRSKNTASITFVQIDERATYREERINEFAFIKQLHGEWRAGLISFKVCAQFKQTAAAAEGFHYNCDK